MQRQLPYFGSYLLQSFACFLQIFVCSHMITGKIWQLLPNFACTIDIKRTCRIGTTAKLCLYYFVPLFASHLPPTSRVFILHAV